MDNLSKGGKELSTNLTQFSSETDRENFNVLKMRSELVHLITNEISLSLENFRKEMFLNYLIKATCPLAEDESLSSRQKELNSVLKQMTSAWQSKVKNSMDRLEVIKKECETISRKKEEFLSQFRAKKTSEAELNRVDEYEKIFQSILKLSKENYMRVTSKYLILRHNGKVAQEVSNQRKKEVLERYEAAKEELSNCEKEVLVKLESAEAFHKTELKTVAQSIRDDVLSLEAETRDLEQKIGRENVQRQHTKKTLKYELKNYNKKYDTLQSRRKFELQTIRSELTGLKNAILDMEQKIHEETHSRLLTLHINANRLDTRKKEGNRNHSSIISLTDQLETLRKVFPK